MLTPIESPMAKEARKRRLNPHSWLRIRSPKPLRQYCQGIRCSIFVNESGGSTSRGGHKKPRISCEMRGDV